jgi:hypothetical protein
MHSLLPSTSVSITVLIPLELEVIDNPNIRQDHSFSRGMLATLVVTLKVMHGHCSFELKQMLALNGKKEHKKLHEASLTLLSTSGFSTTSNIFVPCHTFQVV